MSTNKTQNLQMHDWMPPDAVLRAEFNENFRKIDKEYEERGLNVKWFGAKGDNVANDTSAIQAAINACISRGVRRLVFPAGTYVVSAELIINNANKLYIESLGASIRATSAFNLFRCQDCSNLKITGFNVTMPEGASVGLGRFLRGIRMNYLTLQDIVMDKGALLNTRDEYDDATTDGAKFWNEYIRVERCKVYGGTKADNLIQFQRSNMVFVNQCYFDGGTQDGIKFNSGRSENAYILHNEFNNITDDGVDMYGSGHFLHIENNYFHHGKSYCANLKITGDTRGDTFKAWFLNNRVENNALGVGMSGSQNVLVQGNIFRDSGKDPVDLSKYSHLIRIEEDAVDIRIVDNDFINNDNSQSVINYDTWAVASDKLYCLIKNNRFRGNTAPYLVNIDCGETTASKMIEVEENVFYDVANRGISVFSDRATVTARRNRFVNGAGDGISVRSIGTGSFTAVQNVAEEGLTGYGLWNNTSAVIEERGNSWNAPYNGPTANRPERPYLGQVYFDTTLNKAIYCRSVSPVAWSIIEDSQFNVVDFGAKNDGTDAGEATTNAIKAAISACSTYGGGVVYFPKGVFSVASSLVIPTNVSVRGAGKKASLVQYTGSSGACFDVQGNHVTIEDLGIKAMVAGSTATGIRSIGSTANDTSFLTVDNCNIDLFDVGVNIESQVEGRGFYNTIRDCNITGAVGGDDIGIYIVGAAQGNLVTGGTIRNCAYGIHADTQTLGNVFNAIVEISGCTEGIHINGKYSKVIGCRFTGNGTAGNMRHIRILNDYNSVIGCYFTGTPADVPILVEDYVVHVEIFHSDPSQVTNLPGILRRGTALPTADDFYRGTTFFVEGGAGVADTMHVCYKQANGAYAWRQIF